MLRADKRIFLLIALFSLMRLAAAPFFGLGVDEAHYALYGTFLDLSYVDHPPLVGWLHAVFIFLFGTNEFLVRLPAILLFAATSYCCYQFMLRVTESVRLSLLGVFALNCTFMLNALAIMLLPDSILLLLIFLLIFMTDRIDRAKRPLDFILLGIIFGLMGLAKYTAILLVPPFILFFLMKKRWDVIFSPWMFLAALLAFLMISPVIYWNVTHDWISFRYQSSHVFGSLASSAKNFFVSILAQVGAYSPFLFVAALYGFYRVWRRSETYLRLAVLFGATLLLFFTVTSLFEATLPHWQSSFYLLFVPLGASFLYTSPKKWQRVFLYVGLAISLTVIVVGHAELAGKFVKMPEYKSHFRDIYGYPEMTAGADEILQNHVSERPKALAVTNWTEGSRVMYYGLPYGFEVFVLDDRRDQFDVWQKRSPEGYDLLFLNTEFHNINVAQSLKCDEVSVADSKEFLINGAKVNRVEFVWCINFAGVRR